MTDAPQNNDARLKAENDLRDQLANAPEAPKSTKPKGKKHGKSTTEVAQKSADQSEAESGDQGGGGKGHRGRPHGEIYDDCPVTPLGVRGKLSYYLDVLGQLRSVDNHNAQNIQALFGHQIPQLCYNFPQWKKTEGGGFERVKNRFDQTNASMSMHVAASECGVFNPDNAVRGVGAWTDEDGGLVYHMGDAILVGDEVKKPGRIGAHIYPAQPTIPHPDTSPTAPDPVPEILKTLETWEWTVPDVHPFVALGMISIQMLCGALDWRPVFWLLAPAGAGKSEFQRLIKMLHGNDGLIQTTDATKSGITSKLGQSSLPVAVDELEPGDERSTKERDIIALARVAASGGEWFRGSADQTGVGGKVYSAFLFSSILIPGIMKTQDVQRLIRLELKPLKPGAVKLSLQPRTWRARGARLKQLLITRWNSWPERMAIWRHELECAGVTGRDADNWGVVLAMADMASNADLPEQAVTAAWAKKIAFIAAADREDTVNDSQAMLLHLMSQPFDVYRRGEQFTVAQWIMAAIGTPGASFAMLDVGEVPTSQERRNAANGKLAKVGLRIYARGDELSLFIMNTPIQGLKNLFQGTEWAGGVWKQSASRIPGAKPVQNPLTLAGQTSRGFMVPIRSIPGLMNFPMDRKPATDATSGSGAVPDTSDVDDWG